MTKWNWAAAALVVGVTTGIVRAGPILSSDFEGTSASVDATSSGGATAQAAVAAVGTIDVAGSTTPSTGVKLTVQAARPGDDWAAAAVVGPMPLRSAETDLKKLTLSFMAAESTHQRITVRVESLDAAGGATGALVGEVYPAAPDFYQRYAMELASLRPDQGGGTFDPSAAQCRISFGLRGEPNLPGATSRELRVDNVQLAAPSYYVSPDGDDARDGMTEATALRTPQRAVDLAGPGDIVLLKGGKYAGRGDAVKFTRPGNPAGWIVLKNAPGETPELSIDGWAVIRIGGGSRESPRQSPAPAYIELRGLHVVGDSELDAAGSPVSPHPDLLGKPVAETNGNGVYIEGRYEKGVLHHVRVADCNIARVPGGGLSACFADWIAFENNVVSGTSFFSSYANSGISTLFGSSFDGTSGGYRILVSGNRSFGNRCYQEWTASSDGIAPRKLSDGNGIIIDSMSGNEGDPRLSFPPFNGRTLVVNNVSYNNGGSGIHLVSSPNVDLVNNTCYLNGRTPETLYSQMFGYRSANSNYVNNLLVAPAGQKFNLSSEYGERGNTEVVWSHTLYFGSDVAPREGSEGVTADPMFVAPATGPAADFTLKPESPARGAGTRDVRDVPVPLVDIDGRPRPMDKPPSIGASQP